MKYTIVSAALASVLALAMSCSSGTGEGSGVYNNSGTGSGAAGAGAGPGVGGAGGVGPAGGVGGGIGIDLDSGQFVNDANLDGPCQATGEEVKTETLPVDIIWAVDTSGSMGDEAAAVQQNINAFSQQIIDAQIDVHVVMLAGYPFLGTGVCVGPPLGTGNCSFGGPGDSKPPNFFHHPSAVVDSWNGAVMFVSMFGEYQHMLRPNSLKYLVIVSDDDSAPLGPIPGTCAQYCNNATGFINDYTALHAMMRNASGGPAWKMSGVYAQTQCPNATRPGAFWKTVIDQTGGVHGDICACNDPAACTQTFKAVLDSLAKTITTAAKPLECEYTIPPPPANQTFDKLKVNVELTSNGVPENIGYVPAEAACHPELGGWYYDDEANPTRILTCPKSCEKIKATTNGKVSVAFGCKRHEIPVAR